MDDNKRSNKKDIAIAAAALGGAALLGTAAWLLTPKSEVDNMVPEYACPLPYYEEEHDYLPVPIYSPMYPDLDEDPADNQPIILDSPTPEDE